MSEPFGSEERASASEHINAQFSILDKRMPFYPGETWAAIMPPDFGCWWSSLKRCPASPLECDVQDPTQPRQSSLTPYASLAGRTPWLYVAGITRITPLERSRYDDWLEIFATNVFGAALIARAAIPNLTSDDSQGGALFVSSDAAILAMPGLDSYAASKAALARFCLGASVHSEEIRPACL